MGGQVESHHSPLLNMSGRRLLGIRIRIGPEPPSSLLLIFLTQGFLLFFRG